MNFPNRFYKTRDDYCTYEKHINAPYIRKTFELDDYRNVKCIIGTPGFYDIFINGTKITKGLIAPYISNPDDIVYFDEYNITRYIKKGKNVVGIILGNGMQNSIGGRVWDFDIAKFRNSPSFALEIIIENDNSAYSIFADEDCKWENSPIIFDDLRSGCFYDANSEIKNWCLPEFDDSLWNNVKSSDTPRGEYRLCEADPVVITKEISPVQIRQAVLCKDFDNRENMRLNTQFKFDFRGKTGTLFDFGVNTAGIIKLKINGIKNQKIFIQLCELETSDKEISYYNTGSFYPDGYGQTLFYICKGEDDEIFIPSFCYFGYRYAVVFGLNDNQIKSDSLTMLVANSDIKQTGFINCSDPILNKLDKMAKISDLSNFYYFPTDCPHREKNGWTGDAAVSAEHLLYFFTPEKSYKEWLRNICKAQNEKGALPGIIPTSGWGYEWGNGPAWDNVMSELCWQIYRFRGDLSPALECKESIFRYLSYISQQRRNDGLIDIGLGDWLQPGHGAGNPTAPTYLTDSIITMYIAKKSSDLFEAMKLLTHKSFADSLYNSLRESIRCNLIDFGTMTVYPRCQTAQAMCIYYNVFNDTEKKAASDVLVDIIHDNNDLIDVGLLGIRVIFHVLSECNHGNLAYRMITNENYPSYACFIKQGLTSLPESFLHPDNWNKPDSLNHHFLGDFTGWFAQKVVGIIPNPHNTSPDDFCICPDFLDSLEYAESEYEAPSGKVYVKWVKENGLYLLEVKCFDSITGFIRLKNNCKFIDSENPESSLNNSNITELKPGIYKILKKRGA